MFVLISVLISLIPLSFAANAWRNMRNALIQQPGVLAQLVLGMTCLSALLFSVIVLLGVSEVITQAIISRIAMPNWYLCICIALLCCVRFRHKSYRASLPPSVSLVLGWLVIAGMH